MSIADQTRRESQCPLPGVTGIVYIDRVWRCKAELRAKFPLRIRSLLLCCPGLQMSQTCSVMAERTPNCVGTLSKVSQVLQKLNQNCKNGIFRSSHPKAYVLLTERLKKPYDAVPQADLR